MKNLVKRLAFIALAAIICFSMSACVINLGEDDSGGGGSGSGPSTPTGLRATATSSSEIDLDWNAVSGASGYYVYQSTSSSSGFKKYSNSVSSSDAYAYGLSPNTTYYFRVTAFNSDGESGYSSTASAKTLGGSASTPGKVTGVTATASAYSIRVSWNAVSGATSYTVRRNPEGNTYYDKVYTGSATSYTDTDVTAGRRYYYRVFATAGYYDGEASEYVYATPYGGGASVFYPIASGE
jgi:fibronectin type 3 domain-containing protein